MIAIPSSCALRSFDPASAPTTSSEVFFDTESVTVAPAARAAFEQATARYRSGLAPMDDVAQAQRLLVQARIDDTLARLPVSSVQGCHIVLAGGPVCRLR